MVKAKKMRNYDALERAALVVDHLHILRIVARKICERVPKSVDFDDLHQDGAVGLMDAAARADRRRSNKFSTYADIKVRSAMLDGLRHVDWATRDSRRHLRMVEDAERALKEKLMRLPTFAEVAEELDVDESKLLRWTSCVGPLELPAHDALAALSSPEAWPSAAYESAELRRFLDAAMAELSTRFRQAIVLYYVSGMTMKSIGGILGVNESRVSQILTAAKKKMRASLEAAGVKSIRDLA